MRRAARHEEDPAALRAELERVRAEAEDARRLLEKTTSRLAAYTDDESCGCTRPGGHHCDYVDSLREVDTARAFLAAHPTPPQEAADEH